MNKYLDIDYYPYDKKVRQTGDNTATPVKLRYNLPDGNEDACKLPSLIFGNTYQFMVYNQFKNGWALPAYTGANDLQASADDLWNINNTMQKRGFLYKRLENTKPVILFSQAPIGKDHQEDKNTTFIQKDSLLHLVLRDAIDNDTTVFRHVLPERISLEQAFWSGLLFKMTPQERRTWKCRYNYADSMEPWMTSPYDLDCNTGDGGTKMNDFYPGAVITSDQVKYIPDPLVDGFTLQLYWDEECTQQYLIGYGPEAIFDKGKDYTVNSYGLSLTQNSTPGVTVDNTGHHVTIALKPGMRAYAKLYNHVEDASKQQMLGHDYWLNQLHGGAATIASSDFKNNDADPKSQALIITLTNSHKTPVIAPSLYAFYAVGQEKSDDPDNPEQDQDLAYITDWLNETAVLLKDPNYPCADIYGYLVDKSKALQFFLSKNIIALRPADNGDPGISVPGTNNITFQLFANFERLDAIGPNNFLPGATPTGVLEVWMKKEEFADDPDQYVLANAAPGSVNHLPEKPIYPIDDPANKTYHDYKFDWSADVMAQLQTPLDPIKVGQYSASPYLQNITHDPFRDTISSLAATYNAGTAKFEYRHYELVDTSKFKGYYDDTKGNNNDGVLTPYQLQSNELPVLVLGNQKPDKPSIAYLVTTIRRIFTSNENGITTTQRGNIVTVYLNRGRLTSGRDERIGVLINNNTSYSNIYNDANTISKAGRDVVSDQASPQSIFIRYDTSGTGAKDIVIPATGNTYDARYDEKLSMVSYLPRFDTEKQLWKFQVELDLKSQDNTELHNPFINLAFVHFQPFALDYNTADTDTPNLSLNCRISDAETTTFCYLLPQRSLTATFHKPAFLGKWGSAKITLGCDLTSLNTYQSKGKAYRTNFIICVEGSTDKQFWTPVKSQADGGDWLLMHPLIDYKKLTDKTISIPVNLSFQRHSDPEISNSTKYHHFRLRLVEVEWFRDESWEDLVKRYVPNGKQTVVIPDILDLEDFRVRYVELIY
jgi:hypothetical protein